MNVTKSSLFIIFVAILGKSIHLFFFESRIPAGQGGFAAPGWIQVARTFKEALDTRQERGAMFAVYHRGQLVVEFSGGFADSEAGWVMSPDTLVQMFSTTKALGAVTIAVLVDRGLLDYKAPVAAYWPEFAQNGKENITVEQLLSHQAGLPYTDEVFSFLDLNDDPDKVGRILAQQKPIWEPGSRVAYHGFTMGFYMDQLVRHVDAQHRSLSQFFHDEIATPFDVDAFIGLPQCEHYRVARNYEPDSLHHILDAHKYWPAYWQYLTDPSSVVARELANVQNPDVTFNKPALRAVISVSNNGFSTARALARFFSVLATGGKVEGKALLSERLIQQLAEPLVSRYDECVCFNVTYGRGVTLFNTPTGGYIFGAPGAGGQMGYADPQHQLGWAYLTNHMSLNDIGDDPRYLALQTAMYDAVLEIERKEETQGQT